MKAYRFIVDPHAKNASVLWYSLVVGSAWDVTMIKACADSDQLGISQIA